MDLLQLLNEVELIAREAGSILKNDIEKEVLSENGRDIKLKSDINSEKYILAELKSKHDFPFLSEEEGKSQDNFQEDYYWVIDPLDGTFNFKKNIPFNCVSIALWKKNNPILGVIYDFNHEDLYKGLVGTGSWVNDKEIKVSEINMIDQAVIGTGFPVGMNIAPDSLKIFFNNITKFKKIRMLGAAAMTIAYVGSGKLEAYYEKGINFWDVAAGIAIVKGAGGIVTFDMNDDYKMNIVASNKLIHEKVVELWKM